MGMLTSGQNLSQDQGCLPRCLGTLLSHLDPSPRPSGLILMRQEISSGAVDYSRLSGKPNMGQGNSEGLVPPDYLAGQEGKWRLWNNQDPAPAGTSNHWYL